MEILNPSCYRCCGEYSHSVTCTDVEASRAPAVLMQKRKGKRCTWRYFDSLVVVPALRQGGSPAEITVLHIRKSDMADLCPSAIAGWTLADPVEQIVLG
jgi:hypothetical protein